MQELANCDTERIPQQNMICFDATTLELAARGGFCGLLRNIVWASSNLALLRVSKMQRFHKIR